MNEIEDVIRELSEVLRKHNCLIASPNNTLLLKLGKIENAGEMRARTLASFSYITPRSAEYVPRDSRIAIRWSANSIGTRELETADKKSIIKHI